MVQRYSDKQYADQQHSDQQHSDQQHVAINACQHVQLGGQAFYDERKYFMFAPDDAVPCRVPTFRLQGVAQQATDGTFDFVAKPKLRPQSVLIKKVAHGRVSRTKDDAIQLTLKVFCHEGVNISEAILTEAMDAAEAVRAHQLQR